MEEAIMEGVTVELITSSLKRSGALDRPWQQLLTHKVAKQTSNSLLPTMKCIILTPEASEMEIPTRRRQVIHIPDGTEPAAGLAT